MSHDEFFEWHGTELPYLDHPYNTTLLNERSIEVPIVQAWLHDRRGWGLELGNVLAHYGHEVDNRRVVDRWEEDVEVENLDVFDIEGTYDWIVAISTIEHVRWDEPNENPLGAIQAASHLVSCLGLGGSMIVTVPFGQNPYLDGAILAGGLGAERETTALWQPGRWQFNHDQRIWAPLRDENRWPNAVWIGEWGP